MAEWRGRVAWPSGLGRWILNLKVPVSNPALCHSIGFVSW